MADDRESLTNLVLTYLRHIGARELAAAARFLAPGAEILFPGGVRYAGLTEQSEAAATRYRSVLKRFGPVDVDTYHATVVVQGTLQGENLNGVGFAGVRFVDRFVIADGLIVSQQVWNDLDATGVLAAESTDQLDPRWRASI